jgi:hypothetical protein
MKDESDRYDYDPLTVLVAWGSASLGACFVIFFFLFPLAGSGYDHPWETPIGNNVFLLRTVWCIASYFAAAVFAWLASGLLRRFISAWLFISACGAVIFTFTFWSYAYWNWVQTYQPGSLFRSQLPPPSFDAVLWSAANMSFFYFLLAAMFSFIASLMLLERDREGALHLND